MTVRADSGTTEAAGGRVPRWRRVAESWCRRIAVGQLTLVYDDGTRSVFTGSEPGPSGVVRLHSGRAIRRMVTGGSVGFAEAYMDGDWSTPDLEAVLEIGLRNEQAIGSPLNGSLAMRLVEHVRHWLRRNNRAGSRRNIAAHYDLGNTFYGEWLDETMTYSSAAFRSPDDSLADAQREKYRRLIQALDIKAGDRVLEIGCGWGGFAEIAARETGAHITGITLSQEQAKFARERMARANLADRVDIRIEDYRDTAGTFDKIVSIEMFEAVGERYWPVYFDVVRERLATGGRAALQVITVANERFDAYRRTIDFIQRYIFPGGMLPSPAALGAGIRRAGLQLVDTHLLGASYAETLRRWNQRFQSRWERIVPLGFDERFRRMWTYYLESCEACFRTGATDVGQYILRKG